MRDKGSEGAKKKKQDANKKKLFRLHDDKKSR